MAMPKLHGIQLDHAGRMPMVHDHVIDVTAAGILAAYTPDSFTRLTVARRIKQASKLACAVCLVRCDNKWISLLFLVCKESKKASEMS